jgi:hypothetical protein
MTIHINVRFKLEFLFASLLALLILSPFFDNHPWEKLVLNSFVGIVLIASITTVSKNQKDYWIGLGLAIPSFILSWVTTRNHSHVFHWLELFFLLSFFIFVLQHLAPFALDAEKRFKDRVFAAASVYLLTGLLFALIYSHIHFTSPHAFYTSPANMALRWNDFIYFSFMTLTTTGYGDITPATSLARSLCMVESITGVLYTGVILSLVLSSKKASKD